MSILDSVQFTELPKPDPVGGLPYATHHGVLEILGHSLNVYRLNDGRAIIDERDFYAFFDELGEPAAARRALGRAAGAVHG